LIRCGGGGRHPTRRRLNFADISAGCSQANQLIAATAAALRKAEGLLQLTVPPKRARGEARDWKTGFCFDCIAQIAGVPIHFSCMDHARKRAGPHLLFQPNADIDRYRVAIKAISAPFCDKKAAIRCEANRIE